jgi:hypothetical protein
MGVPQSFQYLLNYCINEMTFPSLPVLVATHQACCCAQAKAATPTNAAISKAHKPWP